jgi:hypothetical protein
MLDRGSVWVEVWVWFWVLVWNLVLEYCLSYHFFSSSEVPLETDRVPGAGGESKLSYRSGTPLPARILSFMQFAIVSSLLPGATQVSWIELLNASLCIMLSFSTATAAPTCGSWTIFRNRRSLSGSSLERIVISISSTICSLYQGEGEEDKGGEGRRIREVERRKHGEECETHI